MMATPKTSSPTVWWRRQLTGEVRIARLRSTLAEKTEALAAVAAGVPQDKQSVISEARRLLSKAGEALQAGDLNAGWALLLESERVAVAADSEEALQARAELLREEVREKLNGWRKLGAVRVLGDPGTRVTPDVVQTALRIRNEHFHNEYSKLELLAGQLARLGLLLVGVLAVILVLAGVQIPPLGQYRFDLIWAAVLGGSGGLLSATRGLTQGAKRKIPDHLANWPITLIRPLLGASAGLAAWIVIHAGVVMLAADDAKIAPLVAAFFAGFSERYFLSLIPGGEK